MMPLTPIQRELYFEDGGATIRRLLKEGGEDMLPLTEWVISPPYVKDHDAAQVWEVTHSAVPRHSR
jgi:amidase